MLYPVRCASFANRRFFAAEKAYVHAAQGRASTPRWVTYALNADRLADAETLFYNEKLSAGKWRHIMSREMGPGQWKSMRSTQPLIPDEFSRMSVPEAGGLGVALEGRSGPVREGEESATLPTLDV